ncbi:unnamed protein product [Arctia plantaginis]|uniref:Uncharacterized protein n=1 Tax=Arctia plantaginis TaxID=874455 RepID=A0A8S0ZGB4_ARCPL|nr:unnamed protein product [Arctia plantaginis]
MGLSNLKMQADAESDGEITECENTPSEEEAMIEYQMTMDAWGDYLKSVRIQHSLKVNLQNLMQDLINSSLTIKEQEDPIGMSCTSLSISSGDLIHDWGELFETEPTRLNQLTACLVYASIFIPAMVVKYYKTEHIKSCQCAEHHCGMGGKNQWKIAQYEADCPQGGDTVFRPERVSSEEGVDGMVDTTLQTDDDQKGRPGYQITTKTRKVLDGEQDDSNADNTGTNSTYHNRNANIIVLLCQNGAFTEAEAMGLFAKSTEGINFVCFKQYAEKIRTYCNVKDSSYWFEWLFLLKEMVIMPLLSL